jgi:hypothetical protein
MISIEKVTNGYIVRIEEGEDVTLVCQREFNSMNVALASVCNLLKERWFENDEGINLIIEAKP